jgi:1,4-dihydroxy-2-naphthoate octaprenyltransferase
MLVAMAVWLEVLAPLSFLTLLSFPLAMRNIRLMKKATPEDLGIIRFLDGDTAKLVLLFSLLLAAANFIAPFL